MDGNIVVVCFLRGIVDELVDGRVHLVVVCALTFVCQVIVDVPIYVAAKSTVFSFARFAFALIVFSFAFAFPFPFPFPDCRTLYALPP